MSTIMSTRPISSSVNWRFVRQVVLLALQGLDPRDAFRRPVLLALELTAIAASILFAAKLWSGASAQASFMGQVALWLWLALLAISAGVATIEARTLTRSRRLRALQSSLPAKVAWLASLGDETPEGRSIAAFGADLCAPRAAPTLTNLPFSAATRMSGATLDDGTELRKGEPAAILRHNMARRPDGRCGRASSGSPERAARRSC
jgi:high-affinity K+ transport system ATPase subunit B